MGNDIESMKEQIRMNTIKLLFATAFVLFLTNCTAPNLQLLVPQNIDFDWQFYLGDVENGEVKELNTEGWRTLDLPHDWSIEGEYSQKHGTDWQSGFLPAGIGWYRKNLEWNPVWEGKCVKIHFEGVYLNSDVWINGHHLGHRPNGYLGFEYDLTNHLKKGRNVIAVKVDHSNPLTGRWYTGSGIYRHVWLKVQNPVHIDNWGVYFATPETTSEKAEFKTEIVINNESPKVAELRVISSLIDANNFEVASATTEIRIPSNKKNTAIVRGTVSDPQLWSPETPYLYKLQTTIEEAGTTLDENTIKVGIRRLQFSPEFGFRLNGKVTKMKGVCDHHTAGSVGAAVPDNVWLYRLRLLKKMGCNAIRTSHNPFSPAFYNICDSLGLMVMNEFLDGWDKEKATSDYGLYFENWWKIDGTDFITRDRNHPSIIIWSIGNEIKQPTREVQKQLLDLFHKLDSTRPITQGGNDPTRGMAGENLPTQLDLKGFNGTGEEKQVFEKHNERYPDEVIVGTEVPHTYQTRGVYRTKTHWRVRDFPAMWEIKDGRAGQMEHLKDKVFPVSDLTEKEIFEEEIVKEYYKDGEYYPIENSAAWAGQLYYQSSYDNATVRAGARKTWQRIRDFPYVIGQFRWGSFDYLGETNNWPSRFGNFGVIDMCGFPKDHFFLYKSMWTDKPMVHILPHWTHPDKEGIEIPVVVYTNCDEVELFLNEKSLGNQKYQDEQLVWLVPYTKGTIKALAKKNGKVLVQASQTTAGEATKIKLLPDKIQITANRTDVVHVAVDITDENGIFCPHAQNVIEFEVSGPAKIIGVDNGDPIDLSAYKADVRRAFRGKVMLLIQATNETGEINIKANSKNLESGFTKISCVKLAVL